MNYEDKKTTYERMLAKYGTIMRMIIPKGELDGILSDDPTSLGKLIDRLADVAHIVMELRILFDIDEQVSERLLDKLLQDIGCLAKSGRCQEPKELILKDCRISDVGQS